jgi:ABC-type glycerol-3-phosphate transport system substrate-binding protein
MQSRFRHPSQIPQAPAFSQIRRTPAWFALWLSAVLLSGCGGNSDSGSGADSATKTAPAPVSDPLNLLVIDSPETGPVISRQYQARTNGTVTILNATWDEVVEKDYAPIDQADLVIYPTLHIGELMSRKKLRELDNAQFADASSWRGLLAFDRERFCVWKGKVIGISLGQTIPVMLIRNDFLDKTGLPVPQTWQDFSALCAAAGKLEPGDGIPSAIDIPLDGRWASNMLFCRAAAAIVVPGRYSTVFDVRTMQPLVDTEPFRQALAGWANDLAPSTGRQTQTPSQILRRFVNGELAVAVTTIHAKMLDESTRPAFEFTIAPTPGSDQVFDPATRTWTKHQDLKPRSVPFVGCEGLMAGITASTHRNRISMDFLSWLLDKQICAIVSTESPSLAPSHKAHIAAPDKWLGDSFAAENVSQYSRTMQEWEERRACMTTLRIRGADQYLDIADLAVRDAILNGKDAGEVLMDCAAKWGKLTEELGKDDQRRQYSASEGVTW